MVIVCRVNYDRIYPKLQKRQTSLLFCLRSLGAQPLHVKGQHVDRVPTKKQMMHGVEHFLSAIVVDGYSKGGLCFDGLR